MDTAAAETMHNSEAKQEEVGRSSWTLEHSPCPQILSLDLVMFSPWYKTHPLFLAFLCVYWAVEICWQLRGSSGVLVKISVLLFVAVLCVLHLQSDVLETKLPCNPHSGYFTDLC